MKTKEELTLMNHEDLVKLYIEEENVSNYYREKYDQMVRLFTGIIVNMEAFCDMIKKIL